jgi:hypothetical protein
MKYALRFSKPERYVSYIEINGKTFYLVEDEEGKELKDIAKPYYEILSWLMNYNSLIDILKTP